MLDSVILQICAVLGECNANYIKEEISRITHENFTNAMVVGSDLKKKPVAIVTALFVSLPAFPVYISIICLRKKVGFFIFNLAIKNDIEAQNLLCISYIEKQLRLSCDRVIAAESMRVFFSC